MQCAVVEFARNVLGLERAHSTEFDKDTPHPVICLLDEQKTITDKGGTMRLGAQPAAARSGQQGGRLLRHATTISERHRHRYEFNNVYRQQFAAHGMQVAGTSPDGSLVEVVEIARPSLVRGRAVPSRVQVASRPRPHPLFAGFIGAAIEKHQTKAKQPPAGQQPSGGPIRLGQPRRSAGG